MKINFLVFTLYFCILCPLCSAQTHVNFFDIDYDITTDSLKKLGLENIVIDIRTHDTLLSLSGGSKDTSVIFEVVRDQYNPNYGKIAAKTIIIKHMNDSINIFLRGNFEVMTEPNDICSYFLVRYKHNNHLYVCTKSKCCFYMTTLYPLRFFLRNLSTFSPEMLKD
jgi:hypothetical protein